MVNAKNLWTQDRKLFFRYLHYSQTIDDIHPSIIEPILPKTLNFHQITNTIVYKHLNYYLRKKLNIIKFSFKSLVPPLQKWLMLSTQNLMDLQHLLGSLYYSKEIKKIIVKKQREKLMTFLGASIYECILKRASLYVPLLPNKLKPEFKSNELDTNIAKAGQYFQEYCLCESPNDLLRRFTLKFDASFHWNFSHTTDASLQMDIISLCDLLLKKEILN